MGIGEKAEDTEKGAGAGLVRGGIIGGAGLGRTPLAWWQSIPPWVEGPGGILRCGVIVIANRNARSH
jgi:hypothetical protein